MDIDFLTSILRLPGGETTPPPIGHSDFNELRYTFYIENIIDQLMGVERREE